VIKRERKERRERRERREKRERRGRGGRGGEGAQGLLTLNVIVGIGDAERRCTRHRHGLDKGDRACDALDPASTHRTYQNTIS